MNDINAITLSGADVIFERSAVAAFDSNLRGELLTPADTATTRRGPFGTQ